MARCRTAIQHGDDPTRRPINPARGPQPESFPDIIHEDHEAAWTLWCASALCLGLILWICLPFSSDGPPEGDLTRYPRRGLSAMPARFADTFYF